MLAAQLPTLALRFAHERCVPSAALGQVPWGHVTAPVVHAPARTATAVLALLARLGAALEPPEMQGDETVMGAELPADRVALLQRELPALTHGEGIIESAFARYRPVRGVQPHRPRIGPDPRDLKTWLTQLGRR